MKPSDLLKHFHFTDVTGYRTLMKKNEKGNYEMLFCNIDNLQKFFERSYKLKLDDKDNDIVKLLNLYDPETLKKENILSLGLCKLLCCQLCYGNISFHIPEDDLIIYAAEFNETEETLHYEFRLLDEHAVVIQPLVYPADK